MALLITKNVTVLGDIDLSQLYVRIKIHNGPGDDPLFLETQVFSSKESYQDSAEQNFFNVNGLTLRQQFPYNRNTDGTDLLGFCHETIKDYLTIDGTQERPVLDPSTGEVLYDPSTGQPIMEEVVIRPKYCLPSEVSFVDVSIG